MSYEGTDPNKRLEQVKAAVGRRFPEFSCLRCGNGTFGLRLRTEDPAPADEGPDNVADFVCLSCGRIDSYHVSYLVLAREGTDVENR